MAYLTREQLTYVDNTVRQPKQRELTAMSLFHTFQVPAWTTQTRYKVMTTSGQAADYVDGADNLPVVDLNMTEATSSLTDIGIALRYSRQQVGEAQQAHMDILNPMAIRARRAMAEAENKIIFNGKHNSNASLNINGLTDDADKLGVQSSKAPIAFDDMFVDGDNGATSNNNLKIRNWFQDAVGMITHLAGYSNAKPILALPQSSIDRLNRPYNDYNPNMTVLNMISPWFSQIKAIPEFEHQYFGESDNKSDLGYIFLNDSSIAQIPIAQQVHALPQEYHNGWTTIPYVERLGGLVMYYPHAFVQLTGINNPKNVKLPAKPKETKN